MFLSRSLLLAFSIGLTAAAPASAAPVELSIDAPAGQAETARRVRGVNFDALAEALVLSGLELPARLTVTLVPDSDPRAASLPAWVVGLALGASDIVIFPDRIGPYPYDSSES
jgi:hypothetical protein